MRFHQLTLWLSVAGFAGLLALNLRGQLQTQEKIDTLAALIAGRSGSQLTPQPVPLTTPVSAVASKESNDKLAPYVIEAPDVLVIEAVLKDPKSGAVEPLPNSPISGSFVVRLDGTVSLGGWGSVPVAGLTPNQASSAIRAHLAKSRAPGLVADNLTVAVDVLAPNSKRYYVITDSEGSGEQVFPFPWAGNETVLDAISNISGLTDVAGKKAVRVVRKTGHGDSRVLLVDWKAITLYGVTATNYRLLPSDRIYVTGTIH